MAIEKIYYVYGHMCLYRSALRPVVNDFLVTERTTNRNNRKIQNKIVRKRCRSSKIVFCP